MLPSFRKRPKDAPEKATPDYAGNSQSARAALLWKQGARLLARGKTEQAISSMRQAFELEPSRLEGRLNLGAALGLTRQFEEALTHLQYVLAFEPQNTMALLNSAACYDGLGRLSDSTRMLEQIVADRPQWKDAHYNLAVAYFKQELFDQAADALRAELQINPQHEMARTLLNKIHLRLPKRSDQAPPDSAGS